MLVTPTKKNKVDLANYNYERDIKNRILISQFSLFEVDVLEEILSSSLTFSLNSLADALEVSKEKLYPMLDKLTKNKLLTYNKETVSVDKEMRKFYEFQMQKFDNRFKPNMDFIQQLLKKVPIEVLPTWYFISRTSDNIFESLIEKYFITPQAYEKYLEDLNFEDPVLSGIMEDVFKAPDFKVRSRFLREKYCLTRAEFEEYMLHLEFNFGCFLSYNRIEEENGWKEVVTPFHEWKEYLFYQKEKRIRSLLPKNTPISLLRSEPFSFVIDAKNVLTTSKNTPLIVSRNEDGLLILSQESLSSLLSNEENNSSSIKKEELLDYFSYLVTKLYQLSLLDLEENLLQASKESDSWISLPHEDFALNLHRHPANQTFVQFDLPSNLSVHKNFREVEKSIQNLEAGQWWDFESFVKSMVVQIGSIDPVMLKKKGRSWSYSIPEYTENEIDFIEAALSERLFESGMIQWGYHKEDKDAFSLTPFGKTILGIE